MAHAQTPHYGATTVLPRYCYGTTAVLLRYYYGIAAVLLRYYYGTVKVPGSLRLRSGRSHTYSGMAIIGRAGGKEQGSSKDLVQN